jgi:hypothetical protein
MSWKFPKHRPLNTDVMDTRDINETLLSFVDEASGELNEHNFLGGMLTDGAEYEDNAGISVTHFHQADDPSWVSSGPSVQNYPPIRMEPNENWTPLTYTPNIGSNPPQMKITFTTGGGAVWLIASFQAQLSTTGAASSAIGYAFALSIDGSILYESLFGSGDSNDETQSAPSGPKPGPATNGVFIPIKLEAYVNLAPGTYEARVEYRTLRTYSGTSTGLTGVFSRELMAIELVR